MRYIGWLRWGCDDYRGWCWLLCKQSDDGAALCSYVLKEGNPFRIRRTKVRTQVVLEKKENKTFKKNASRKLARELYPPIICNRCGAGSRLHVHHKDGNALNNNVDNIEHLCYDCHMKHHKLFKYNKMEKDSV